MTNNALVKPAAGGLAAIASGALAAFATATTSAGMSGTVGKRLTHSGKTGEWKCAGQPVDVGKTYIFDMLGVRQQWMAWKDSRPVHNITEKLIGGAPLPAEEDLPDFWNGRPKGSDGWQKNLVYDIYDPETGETFEVTLKADSEYRPACRLNKEFATKGATRIDENGDPPLPVVEIGDSTFFSKAANENLHAPVLTIVEWMSRAEVDAILDQVAEAEGEPEVAGDYGDYDDPSPEEQAAAAPEERRPAPARRTGRRV